MAKWFRCLPQVQEPGGFKCWLSCSIDLQIYILVGAVPVVRHCEVNVRTAWPDVSIGPLGKVASLIHNLSV